MTLLALLTKIEPWLRILSRYTKTTDDYKVAYYLKEMERLNQWGLTTIYLEHDLPNLYGISYRTALRKRQIYNTKIHMRYSDHFTVTGLFERLKAFDETAYGELLGDIEPQPLDKDALFKYGRRYIVDGFDDHVLNAIFAKHIPAWRRLKGIIPTDLSDIAYKENRTTITDTNSERTSIANDVNKEAAINTEEPQTSNTSDSNTKANAKGNTTIKATSKRDAANLSRYIDSNREFFSLASIEEIILKDIVNDITLTIY